MKLAAPAAREIVAPALVGAAVFAIAYAGIEFTRESGRIAALWGANAVLLAALMRFSGRSAVAALVAGFFGNVAANLLEGDSLALSFGLPVCNLVEVAICYFGLKRFGGFDLTRPKTLAVFIGLAAGPGAAASALLGAGIVSTLAGADFLSVAAVWHRADALGLITFTPLFAAIAGMPTPRPEKRVSPLWGGLSIALFIAALAGIFGQNHYPLTFLAAPALVAIAFQFGFLGSAVALVVTMTVAIFSTLHGLGPLSRMVSDLREQIVILQAFVAVNALMALGVSAVLAERERLAALSRAARAAAEAADQRRRESETRYRLLAEHTSDVIVLTTLDRRLDYVSPSVKTMLGYAAGELDIETLRGLLHEDDRGRVLALRRGLGPNRPTATSVHRMRRKSGDYIWVESAYAFVPAGDQSRASLLAVVRDVTERQAQAAQLEAAREAAEAGLKAKSEFLAMMSHELRTPLNSIIGFSDLLREGDELRTDLGRRYARNIEASSKALLSIVNDVMDVSKIEAGAVELDVRPFSFRRLVGDAAAIMRGEAEAKGLGFGVEVDDRIPDRLIGDDARIRQVLLNLLSNAIKFTSHGGVSVKADCVAEGPRRVSLRIAVADTGIGIPDDKLHRLFRRFSQVDQTTSRRFGGTGLGLSISNDLVAMMGGAIKVTSREGVGTTFEVMIKLPTAPLASGEPQAHETAPGAAIPAARRAGEAPLDGMKILVAEDVVMNQELLTAMLKRWGCKVDLAGDGVEAVAAAAAKAYDLILMDVQMPLMDGVEATRRIRAAEGPCRAAPIVALTANVLPEEIACFHAAGMDDHVGKPFAPDALKSAIERRRPAETRAAEARPQGGGALVHDDAALAELASLVGADAVASYLGRFETQLRSSFLTAPRDEAELSNLRYEAHALASTAGMLGFRRLSEACVALETRIGQTRAGLGEIVGPFAEALAARDASLPALAAMRRSEPVRKAG